MNSTNKFIRIYDDIAVKYKPLQSQDSNWLTNPYIFQSDAELVGFLAQLEEEGYAQMTGNELSIRWDDLYQVLENSEYKSSIYLLQLPKVEPWRPILSSHGGLTDKDFSIIIAGWITPSGKPYPGNVNITGGLISYAKESALLPQNAYNVSSAVKNFHQRDERARTPDSNRYAWAKIRRSAISAGAELTDFLQNTIVITPEKLRLDLRKVSFGDSRTIEVIPSFDGATERWLEIFDRTNWVQDRYDVPDQAGIVHILISNEVKNVLNEIKNMPGRRVAGERAEAFVSNPFAVLGPGTEKVIDPDEFENARIEAGISFARFTAQVQRDEQGLPYDISLLIEESIGGNIDVTRYRFEKDTDLKQFINKLDDRINLEAQFCHWQGFDLEILGDTPDQLTILKEALRDWLRLESISISELYDLSKYSDRIEGFGIEKPYYSPYIKRKDDGEGWIPENVDPILAYTPPGSDQPIAIVISKELEKEFKERLKQAKEKNVDTFDFPGCPRPVAVKEAEDIIITWGEALKDIHHGKFDPGKAPGLQWPTTKKGLVVKPNIIKLDHNEIRGFLTPQADIKPALPRSLKPTMQLKDHQLKGIAWLQHLWGLSPEKCRGAVLADDMGLGKTVQLLTFIAKCVEDHPDIDPFLIVAPVSLLDNWIEEYGKFFKDGAIKFLTLYGSSINEKRLPNELLDDELRRNGITRLLRPNWISGAQVVLTTYETLRNLEFSFARVKWSVMICDEAQKIKNPNALVTRAAKKQNVRFKIACTGTPVENTLTDLWCLFDFIQPGLLGALNDFGSRYRRPIEAESDEEKERVKELRSFINPQMLRRNKEEVAKDLPSKILDKDCKNLKMSARQRELYGQAISIFRKQDNSEIGLSFKNHLGVLQYLRRLCADPKPIEHYSNIYVPLGEILSHSPKMDWLMRAMEVILQKEEKAIVFCEFRDLQRKIQRCIAEQYGFVADIINGGDSAKSRQKRIKAFQEQPGFGVIILSPLAIGFGVNIQAANHVIHFTRLWNPAKEDQATDRAYRIGQTKDVYVYCPVITADFLTFDAKLDKLLEWKRDLSKDVLNGAVEVSSAEFNDLEDVDGCNAFSENLICPAEINMLSPDAFEAFCAALWAKQGFSKVYRTPRSGDDGVDVVAINRDQGVLIQCKTSMEDGKRLGWDAIKEVVAGTAAYKQRHPSVDFKRIAVTNQYFNSGAQSHARINNVELIDREMLAKILEKNPIKRIDLDFILFNE